MSASFRSWPSSMLLAVFLLACSSSGAGDFVVKSDLPAPSAAQTLARLARFSEFAGHLGEGGALERSGDAVMKKTAEVRRGPHGSWTLLGADALQVRLSTRRSEATHIGLAGEPDVWIELRDEAVSTTTAQASELSSGEVLGGALIRRDVALATDLVQVVESNRFEEIRVLRTPSAAAVVRQRMTLGPSVSEVRLVGETGAERLEVVRRDGVVRMTTAPSFAMDDAGQKRVPHTALSHNADGTFTLTLSLDTTGLTYPIAVDPIWTGMPDLPAARCKQGAAPLAGGKAMLLGGWRVASSVTSATTTQIIFDGTSKTWGAPSSGPGLTDSMLLTVLSDGALLATGGNLPSAMPDRGWYFYDPTTSSWSGAGSFGMPYCGSGAALISSDRVLITGCPSGDVLLWDRSTKATTTVGTYPSTPHAGATLTGISGDRVLLLGGSTTATDIWSLSTKSFSAGPASLYTHSGHTATVLTSGKVLIAGGGVATAEVFDPTTNTFSPAGTMLTGGVDHTATLLGGERVLVVAGSQSEIYDGTSNTWQAAASLAVARSGHTATPLGGSRVLVAGGVDSTGAALSTAELFEPYANGAACTHATDCLSTHCVDGICCDSACTGQCEACNKAGSEGTCSPVAGAPVGTRTPCAVAGTGVCANACDGADRTKCNFGATTIVCSPAACAAGTSRSETKCDGAGNCPAPTKADCAPYACGGSACKTTCASDADCGGANVCDTATGACHQAIAAKCSSDGRSSVPTDPTKPTVACAPYLCDNTTGKCAVRCTSTRDCVGGTVCDTSSGQCQSPPQSAGGCHLGVRPGAGAFAQRALLGFVALTAAMRRRRRLDENASHLGPRS